MANITNEQLYELRKKWLEIIGYAKELDNLTPEQLKEYNIHPSRHAGSYVYEDIGKFLDDYYRYVFLRDQASEDPLTHEEIARFKEETRNAIIDADQLIFFNEGGCVFYPVEERILGITKDIDSLRAIENKIQKATDIITPEYGFYKKWLNDSTVKLTLKVIDEEIKLNNIRIAEHNSDISSIGYDHYEDSEYGEVDYDVNEKYKPHYDAIAKLKANNELLESFKIKLQEDLEKEKQKEKTPNTPAKKQNVFKRLINRLKKKKADTKSSDTNLKVD